jgi:uncharacterized repeat protein (TIGR01451 family)
MMDKQATKNLPHQAVRSGQLAVWTIAVASLALALLTQQASATIDNVATASGTYNAAPVTSNTDAASVTITPQAASLSVVKTASDTTDVTVGQVITYTYTITNTGNSTVSNVAAADVHNGSGTPPVPGSEALSNDTGTLGDSTDATPNNGTWSSLAPGDSITFTATYTVTQNDVDTKQ